MLTGRSVGLAAAKALRRCCQPFSPQITMSSRNVIVCRDSCLTSSINLSVSTANKRGALGALDVFPAITLRLLTSPLSPCPQTCPTTLPAHPSAGPHHSRHPVEGWLQIRLPSPFFPVNSVKAKPPSEVTECALKIKRRHKIELQQEFKIHTLLVRAFFLVIRTVWRNAFRQFIWLHSASRANDMSGRRSGQASVYRSQKDQSDLLQLL